MSVYKSRYHELKAWRDRLSGPVRKHRPTNHHFNRAPNRQRVAKPDHKFCRKCEIEKPRTEFYRNSGTRDGLQNHCKACHKKCNAITNPKRNRSKA